MADFVPGAALSSRSLSGATVQWTTVATAQRSLATPIAAEEAEVTPGDPTASDLLQQAMNEVSFDAGGGVSYMEHGGEVVYVREDGKLVSLDGVIASGDMAVMSVPQATGVVGESQHGAVTMDVGKVLYKNEKTDTLCEFMPSDPGIINVTPSATLTYSSPIESAYLASSVNMSQAACPIQISNVRTLSSSETEQNNAVDVSSSAVETDSAPLGSSRNPIRIIQRGNQYTAMQHLTSDQLTQILQVIQSQQAQAKNPSSSGAAILCNPEDSGSEAVYRITTSSASTLDTDSGSGTFRMVSSDEHGHQKRIARKRKKDDEDRTAGSELSRQEKEERKKHRPRTRSGRVSKPPQYMVKDYKHIHPVDYDEDYDDSDGGYSDFKHSGDEAECKDRQMKDDNLMDDGNSDHWKHYKCETCEKRYVATAGLAHHYCINPTHGKMLAENIHSSTALSTLDCSSDGTSVPGISGYELQDLPSADQGAIHTPHVTALPHPPAVRKRGRGRPPIYNVTDKRRAQLREFVQRCSAEDLLTVALPRLVRIASVWDFLSAHLPQGMKSASDVSRVLQEYNELRCQVKTVCEERLTLVNSGNTAPGPEKAPTSHPVASISETADAELMDDVHTDHTARKYYEITSSDVADSLGLVVGQYEYVERWPETLVNDSVNETSRAASLAADSSRSVPLEVETSNKLLPGNSQEDIGRTETMLVDPSITSCENLTDSAVHGDDADNLQPDYTLTDSHLETSAESACSGRTSADGQTDADVTDNNEVSVLSGSTDNPVVTAAEPSRLEPPDGDIFCVERNVNGSIVHCDHSPIRSTDVLEADGTCSDTNIITLTCETPKQTTRDAFCQSAGIEPVCRPDSANLDFETAAHCDMQSNDTADRQQNSSSETDTLLPTVDDVEGLLKVISRT